MFSAASANTPSSTAIDDFGATSATAGEFDVGAGLDGSIELADDRDWFVVQLRGGVLYELKLTGRNGSLVSDLKLGIVDVFTNRVTALVPQSADGTYNLARYVNGDNPYTFQVTSAKPADYHISVVPVQDDFTANTATAGRLAVDGSATGTIDAAGDRDWFAVELDALTGYAFSGSANLTLRVYGLGNVLLTEISPGRSFVPARTDTYYLQAESATTGSYQVAARRLADDVGQSAAGAARIGAGETVTAGYNYAGDHDWFRLAVVAGQTYSVKLTAPGAWSTPAFSVVADGASINQLPDNGGIGYQSLTFKALTGGDVLIKTQGWGLSGYTVASTVIGIDDHGDAPAQATPLAIGSSTRAKLEVVTDIDVFRFTLEAGVSYVFKALEAPAPARVAGLPPGWGPSAGPTYTVTPLVTGEHYVYVSSQSLAGDYTLLAARDTDDYAANAATTGALAIGGSVSGKLESLSDRDWIAVTLEAGKRYAFDASFLVGHYGADPTLSVLDAGGVQVAEANWFLNPTLNLAFSPTVSGTYYVQMASVRGSHHDRSAGAYTLRVRTVDADDHPAIEDAVLGVEVSGRHEIKGDTDTFRYTFAANTYYKLDATLFDASGKVINNVDRPVQVNWAGSQFDIPFIDYVQTAGGWIIKPSKAGLYTASVRNENVAAYRFTVTTIGLDDVPDFGRAPAVQVGGQVTGTLEVAGDQDRFLLQLQAGQKVNVTLSGAASGAGTIDFARVQQTLGVNTEMVSRLAVTHTLGQEHHALFTAPAAGEYVIYLGQYAPSGSYPVGVRDVTSDTAGPELVPAASAGGAAGQDLRGNIVLQFNEAIMRGSAGVGLYNAAGDQVEWFAQNDTVRLGVTGTGMSLDPRYALAPGAAYTIKLAAASVADLAGNALAAPLEFSFRTAPAATAPGDGNAVYQGTLQGARIDGGAGLDTAYYAGLESHYTFVRKDGGVAVSHRAGGGAADLLLGVERVMFDGPSMRALDIDGVGGQAYRIYKAAFGRTPDQAGLGYWIAMMDGGITLEDVAAGFVDSNEFKNLYGANPTHLELVTRLYDNVLRRPGEAAGIAYWVEALDKGVSLASVLAGFSESAENLAGVLPLIGNGFSYQPWG